MKTTEHPHRWRQVLARNPRKSPSLRRRIGRRGIYLLTFASIWFLTGLGTLLGLEFKHPDLIHLLVEPQTRAALWFLSALCALVAAFVVQDRWAFGVLCVMPAVRLGSYLWAWTASLIPGEPAGYARGWYSAIFYLLMLVLVLVTAGMREPEDEGIDFE